MSSSFSSPSANRNQNAMNGRAAAGAGSGVTLYEHNRQGSIIPREIISWLQLLQLSQSIKFPKRDLSNGYLVAEICSLYWPDVNMHSFRNRLSVAAKRENWELLRKAFTRNGVPISHKVVEGIILCKDHYAESFLRQLYTLLTGKEIMDAKPLRKNVVEMEVYNPGVLAQQMKSTMEAYRSLKEDEEKGHEDKPPGATDDRGGPNARGGGAADLHNLPDISVPNPNTTGEKKNLGVQPIRTFNPDADPEANANIDPFGATPTTEDGRSGFEFEVEVRAAERTSTVVKEPVVVAGRRASLMSNATSLTAPGAASTKPGVQGVPASATEWVESIVKRFTDDGWRLTPDCPTYMQFLLQHEGDLEGAVQGAIWNALLSRIGELVDMIKHNSVALGEVVALMLVSPESSRGIASWGGVSQTTLSAGGLSPKSFMNAHSSTMSSSMRHDSMETTMMSMMGGGGGRGRRQNTPIVTSPRVFMFLAAILSHLTDLDPFYAFSAFVRSVLSSQSIQLVLRRLNYHLADMYASLLCSVISTDQETAMALLPDLLSAAYESITAADHSAEARMSYLVLLRSVITRLVRPSRQMPALLGSPPALEQPASPSNPSTPSRGSPAQQGSPAVRFGGPNQNSKLTAGTSPNKQNSSIGRAVSDTDNAVAATPENPVATPPSMSATSIAFGGTLHSGKPRDLSSDLQIIASLNTVTALSSESAQVRVAGVAVAASLALTAYPVYQSISQFLKLLFPQGAASVPGNLSPVDHVLRATWLRAVQERLALQETRFSPDNPMDNTTNSSGGPRVPSPTRRRPRSPAGSSSTRRARSLSTGSTGLTMGGSESGFSVGAGARDCGLVTRDLLPLFEGFSRFLMQPGGHKKSKALVAFELAISLLYLPLSRLPVSSALGMFKSGAIPVDGLHIGTERGGSVTGVEIPATADSVAEAVMTFFIQHCTSDIVSVVVAPPSEHGGGSGGSSGGGGGGGGGVAGGGDSGSNHKSQRHGGAAVFGRGKDAGCLVLHPVLGPLCVDEMLRRTCSVLLCRALYKVLPTDIDAKDAARRLGVRAAGLARERVVPPDMLRRLQWLFWIVVSGRGFHPLQEVTAFINKRTMRRRWREVLFSSYDDIALITSAGDTLMQQRARVDEQAQSLIELASRARRIVFRWHTGLNTLVSGDPTESDAMLAGGKTSSLATHKKSLLLEPNSIFEESTEKINRAMDWFHNTFNPGMKGPEDDEEEE